MVGALTNDDEEETVLTGTAASDVDPQDAGTVDSLLTKYSVYASPKQAREAATKPYDDYAARLAAARNKGGSKMEQISQMLIAYGQPSHSKGAALAAAASAGMDWRMRQRELEQKYALADAEIGLKRDLAGQDSELRYGLQVLKNQKGVGGGKPLKTETIKDDFGRMVTVITYPDHTEYRRTGDNKVWRMDGLPSREGVNGEGAAAAAPGASPAAAAPAAAGSAPGMDVRHARGTGDELAKRFPNAGFQAGDTAIYEFDTVSGEAKKVSASAVLEGEEAWRKSGFAWKRGQFDKDGVFQPTDKEKDRLPSQEELQSSLETVLSTVGTAERQINEMRELKKLVGSATTGLLGSVMKFVPGSAAHDMKNKLVTAAGNIAISRLQEMRAQSVNGSSGLGALTAPELELLKNSIASLEQSNDGPTLIANFDKVINVYEGIIRKMDAGGARDYQLLQQLKAVRGGASTGKPAGLKADPLKLFGDD